MTLVLKSNATQRASKSGNVHATNLEESDSLRGRKTNDKGEGFSLFGRNSFGLKFLRQSKVTPSLPINVSNFGDCDSPPRTGQRALIGNIPYNRRVNFIV